MRAPVELEDDRRRRLVRRIANLLRIAERDDGPEADTARMLARRLMVAHGIEVVLEKEAEPRLEIEHLCVETELEPIWWRTILMNDLAVAYNCQSLTTRGVDGRLWFVWLIGPPDRVRQCAIHYEWVLCKILQTRQWVGVGPSVVIDPKAWTEGVCCGALQSLVDRMKRSPEPVRFDLEVAIHKDDALVRTSVPARVELEPEDTGPQTLTKLPTVELDPDPAAFRRGYRTALRYSPEPPAVCFGAIESLDLSRQTTRVLRAAGIERVYDLVRLRPGQLRAVPRIGRRRRSEIHRALSQYGLELRQDW